MNRAIAAIYAISITHEGHALTPQQNSAIVDKVPALISEIERLEKENRALRNLAHNLRPGPISEALAGSMY